MESKGLILAGPALELRPSRIDDERNRHMVPVANRPILLHALESMASAGISDVAIAVPADLEESVAETVAEATGASAPWRLRISYARTDGSGGVGTALLSARSWLDGHPFVVQHGDGLIRRGLADLMATAEEEDADALLLMQTPASSQGSHATTLGMRPESFDRGRHAHLAMTGVQIFGPGFLRRAAGHIRDSRPAADLSGLATELAHSLVRVRVRKIDGWRRFEGDPEVLLEMNRLVLEDLAAGTPVSAPGSRVEGRVSIHPTAVVRSSVVRGPAVIGAGVTVEDAYVGPYTAIGDDARIECAELENSIVFPGAAVLRVAPRLEGCVLGRGARIERNFAVPRGMRIRVGDGASVMLD